MINNIIIHISEVNISPTSGMGRVEYHWKEAFEKSGFIFLHIGPNEVGRVKHPAQFPYKAYKYYKKLKIKPVAFIVHEPAAGFFIKRGIPCIVESHGVERRYWESQLKAAIPGRDFQNVSLKTKLLFPLWRLRGCDQGLKNADKLLLINSDDKAYVKAKYNREDSDILVFKNGINLFKEPDYNTDDSFTILFNGSWIERKGIDVLLKAAKLVYEYGLKVNYLLIGTSKDEKTVLQDWDDLLKPNVKIIPQFQSEDEVALLNSSSLFVLPSYAEGQPLSLLQAMAAGKCCITTNCCGQKDIITDGLNGFLFTPGDFQALANLIIKCYESTGIINSVGLNAKNHVKSFTWANVSNEVVNFVLND